ncbi:YXWGXW repeat-containing protein [Zavarzinella formosa]|uniref:YXWGXW repeat-containing protein n=1 Tax=Zavarzinella formosa TaxID=360055 RepID=UPI0002F5B73F|nr:YXWGXW repeat-containing protein [Zavarzinella formosa]
MRLLRTLALCAITIAIPSVGWAAEEEVEALARGAIHEAYAEPSERQPTASPIVPKEPPKPIEELPPDQKPEGDNVQWIPGYWSWDEDRKDFVWISGFWRVPPPDRTWMPGSWHKNGDGWQWSGGFWAPVQAQKAAIEYLPEPPKPLDDAGASVPAPSPDQVYVPGSWVYNTRYVWRPGYWSPYRANWIWQPAHYRWTPCGYVFIDGYWDYPLANRGVLFAPVYIPRSYYAAPAYVYTPTYIVREPCLYGAFFARRGYGSYYFGDYFAPNYATLGFTAWSGHVSATVRLGGYYDPLFSHYSVGYARDPYWGGGGLVNLYVGRYKGDFARPPVSYTQQTVVINNFNTTNVKNVNNVQMLTTLRDAPKTTNVRLAAVPEAVRREQQVHAREVRAIGVNRAEQEVRLVSAGPPRGPVGGVAAPHTLKLDVPTHLQPKVATPVIEPAKPGHVLPKADRPHGHEAPKLDPRPTFPNPMPKIEPRPVGPKGGGPKFEPKISAPTPVPTVPVVAPKPVSVAEVPAPKIVPKLAPMPVTPAPVVVPKPAPIPVVPAPVPVVVPKPAPVVPVTPAPVVIPKPAPVVPVAPVVVPRPAPIPVTPAPAIVPRPAPAPVHTPPVSVGGTPVKNPVATPAPTRPAPTPPKAPSGPAPKSGKPKSSR